MKVDRRTFLKGTLGSILGGWVLKGNFGWAATQTAKRPNIIVIMSDDMGFSDLGCYGSEIKTPNLDRLAAGGMRFTQFYNCGRCCPTRASLLTGLYPHQAGVGHMMGDDKLPGYKGDLNKNCMTMGEVMKSAGYATYMVGKWHVTRQDAVHKIEEKYNWPLQRGFDRYYGIIKGGGSYYDPATLVEDNQPKTPDKPDYYLTESLGDYACKYISEHCKEGKKEPLFMYLAFTAAHWPMHAKPSDIKKYKGRYEGGWDKLRKERYERQKQLKIIKDKWGLTERNEDLYQEDFERYKKNKYYAILDWIKPWEEVPQKDRALYAARMEVYAAMIDNMDQNIGRIVEELKANGQLDNTLILFLQDNGGCAEETGTLGPARTVPGPKEKSHKMAPNEWQTSVIPHYTRDGRPLRWGWGVKPGPDDTFIACGSEWAFVSNTPFRMFKHWVHEGGISTPLIAHWPDGITSQEDFHREPCHLIDIMATCVDVGNANYPAEYKGNKITPLEGRSLGPIFKGQKTEQRNIFWEHEGNRAVRQGRWKLVSRRIKGKWELYNMDEDRTERHDRAEEHPEKVKELAELWEKWALHAKAKPWPWDNRKPF